MIQISSIFILFLTSLPINAQGIKDLRLLDLGLLARSNKRIDSYRPNNIHLGPLKFLHKKINSSDGPASFSITPSDEFYNTLTRDLWDIESGLRAIDIKRPPLKGNLQISF